MLSHGAAGEGRRAWLGADSHRLGFRESVASGVGDWNDSCHSSCLLAPPERRTSGGRVWPPGFSSERPNNSCLGTPPATKLNATPCISPSMRDGKSLQLAGGQCRQTGAIEPHVCERRGACSVSPPVCRQTGAQLCPLAWVGVCTRTLLSMISSMGAPAGGTLRSLISMFSIGPVRRWPRLFIAQKTSMKLWR